MWLSIIFIFLGVIPLLPSSQQLNLSVWLIISCNGILAFFSNLVIEGWSFSTSYLLASALIISLVFITNFPTGQWSSLPKAHKLSAFLLPLLSMLLLVQKKISGGEIVLTGTVIISCLLTVQILDSILRLNHYESVQTWGWFFLANLVGLLLSWQTSMLTTKILLFVWSLQSFCVSLASLFIKFHKCKS